MAIFGLAYRENVKETAFSAAIRLVDELRRRGARALISDPLYTPEELSRYAGEPVPPGTLPECDAAIMQACHDQFRDLAEYFRTGFGFAGEGLRRINGDSVKLTAERISQEPG